jgi:hypothetical protein
VTRESDWLGAFPLRPATEAVDALCQSWHVLAARYRLHFHPRSAEPDLTRVLKAHVENVTARERGLLGMWSTEGVINRVDFGTGKVVEERRTDIVYGWNDEKIGIQLVFEFKKLNRLARSRTHYLNENGLLRFVTGIYGQHQPVAAMVGILVDPFDRCVPTLRGALSDATLGPPLRLRPGSAGHPYDRPSRLFPGAADFDTEHDRPSEGPGANGVIRVAHLFLSFGYAIPTTPSSAHKKA